MDVQKSAWVQSLGMTTFHLELSLLVCFVIVTSYSFFVTDPGDIEKYLCDDEIKSGMKLTLPSYYNHTISKKTFCMIENVSNVTVESDSPVDQVYIICKRHWSGFGFFNTTNLKLHRITFIHCGGEIKLPPNVEEFSNRSNIFIGAYQRAVLLFTHCLDTQLHSINIPGPYKGIGILFLNALGEHTNLAGVNVTNSFVCQSDYIGGRANFSCTGSGIVFVFIDSKFLSGTYNVNLHVSTVNLNNNRQISIMSTGYSPMELWNSKSPILGGTGLTIIQSSKKIHTNIKVIRLLILNNIAVHCGAILILFHKNTVVQSISMTNLNISNNIIMKINGNVEKLSSGITLYISGTDTYEPVNTKPHSMIHITNATFMNNNARRGGAILLLAHPSAHYNLTFSIIFSDFISNLGYAASFEPSVLDATHFKNTKSLLDVYISNVCAYKNTASSRGKRNLHFRHKYNGVFSFMNTESVVIENCEFYENTGSALKIHTGALVILGELSCENNTSDNGGCIQLRGFSSLLLTKTTHAVFKGNKALLSGGAIYGESLHNPTDVCSIQPYQNTPLFKYPLVFENNDAYLDGIDIKVYNLYECSFYLNQTLQKLQTRKDFTFYHEIFQFLPVLTSKSISGKEAKLRFCNNNKLSRYNYFSGQSFVLQVYATDLANNSVYATVIASIYSLKTNNFINLLNERNYNLYYNVCNNLSFTVISNETTTFSASLQLQSTSDASIGLKYQIQMTGCPFGFSVSKSDNYRCICSPFLQSLNIVCDIQRPAITLPLSSWFGWVSKGQVVEAFSLYCPNEYCKSDYSTLTYLSLDELCMFNRTGIMCGGCQDEMSLVFGSDECHRCSNIWIISLIPYALAGLLLIFVLFAIKLTIAGGIMGSFIFFANMSVISLHGNLLNDSTLSKTINILLAFLNLNLGYPVCFYHGMNAVSKTALQFAFPVYLWCLVLGLIILSRFSTRITHLIVSSSVQVLATLIQLSFGKILLTACDILTSSNLLVSDNHAAQVVWYFDGNVQFFSGYHKFLVIASMFALLVFILPHLIFTTSASFFKHRSYRSITYRLRPLIEAYQGPYKDRYRFWYGMKQWLMTLLYVLYSVLRGTHPLTMILIHIVIISVLIIAQIVYKPFKKKINNVIDGWFMFLLYIMDLLTYFFLSTSKLSSLLSSVSASVVLLIYLMSVTVIIISHCIMSKRSMKHVLVKHMQHIKHQLKFKRQSLIEDIDHHHFYETLENRAIDTDNNKR